MAPMTPPKMARGKRSAGTTLPWSKSDLENEEVPLSTFIQALAVEKQDDLLPDKFDPTSLIDVFMTADKSLASVCSELEKSIAKVASTLSESEVQHGKIVTDLEVSVEDIVKHFRSLDSKINTVGNTAVRIGNRLESIERYRSRAVEATQLLEEFQEFSVKKGDRLSGYFRDSKKIIEASKKLRRLQRFVQDMTTSEAAEAILHHCENFERRLLDLFQTYSDDNDYQSMKDIAEALHVFNDGQSLRSSYVNSLPLFLEPVTLAVLEGESGERRRVHRSSTMEDRVLSIIDGIYKNIESTTVSESKLIQSVFPDPETVMKTLLERLFEQKIQNTLEAFFEKADTMPDEVYLNFLAKVFEKTKRLVDTLQPYAPRSMELDNFINSYFLRSRSEYGDRENIAVQRFSQQAVDDYALFLAPLEERENVVGKSRRSLDNFSSSDSMESGTESDSERSKAGERSRRATAAVVSELPSTIARIIDIHSKALERCKLLSENGKLLDNVLSISKTHIDAVEQVFGSLFRVAHGMASGTASEGHEPGLLFLSLVHKIEEITQTWIKYCENNIEVILSDDTTLHAEFVSKLRRALAIVERQIVIGLENMLVIATSHLRRILETEQKKTDYRPKEDGAMMAEGATRACRSAKRYMLRVFDHVSTSLQGDNQTSFMRECGIGFYKCIFDHIKKQTFNSTGALQLVNDMSEYRQSVDGVKVPEVIERFDGLKKIVSLFLVLPKTLPSLIDELASTTSISLEELRALVQLRSDYKTSKINRFIL